MKTEKKKKLAAPKQPKEKVTKKPAKKKKDKTVRFAKPITKKEIAKEGTVIKDVKLGPTELHPSSAEIWLECYGSLLLNNQGSQFFQNPEITFRGTMLHSILYNLLKSIFPAELLNKTHREPTFTGKGFEKKALDICTLDFVRSCFTTAELAYYGKNQDDIDQALFFTIQCLSTFFKTHQKKTIYGVYLEHTFRRTLKRNLELNGTPDILIDFGDEIVVLDYKMGYKSVKAQENIQLSLYAWLYAVGQGREEANIAFVIIQPRDFASREGRAIPMSKVSKDLEKLVEAFPLVAVQDLKTGSHCRYCSSSDVCPEFKKVLQEFFIPGLLEMFEDRIDAWPELLKMIQPVQKNLELLYKRMLEAAKAGVHIPGFVLEKGSGKRFWVADSQTIAETLGIKEANLYTKELKSPADVEKMFTTKDQKRLLGKLVAQSGNEKLVEDTTFSNEIEGGF